MSERDYEAEAAYEEASYKRLAKVYGMVYYPDEGHNFARGQWDNYEEIDIMPPVVKGYHAKNCIDVCVSPNGKWVWGYWITFSQSGGVSGPSVFGDYYATRKEAVAHAVAYYKKVITAKTDVTVKDEATRKIMLRNISMLENIYGLPQKQFVDLFHIISLV